MIATFLSIRTLLQSYEISRSICYQNQTIILLIIYRNKTTLNFACETTIN